MPTAALTTRTPATPSERIEGRTLRVAAYVRVSSEDQVRGYSLDAQRQAIEGEATARAATGDAWDVTWYEEPGKSARAEKLAKRVRLMDLLADVGAGRYDLVVVHKLDRLARSLQHQLAFIARFAEAGVGFTSVVERPDFATPTGRLMANIVGSFAQFYTDNLGEEVKKGMRVRATRDGLQMNRVPWGYAYTGPKSAPAADRAPTATGPSPWDGYRRLVALALAGHTDQEIAERLNAGGWRMNAHVFTRQTVRVIRTNPFYRPAAPGAAGGTVVQGGAEYPGAHEAAASWEEWHVMRRAAAGRRRGRYRRPDGATPFTAEFRGLLVCAGCEAAGRGTAFVRRTNRRNRDGCRHVYEVYWCVAHGRGDACPDDRRFARVEDVRAAWVAWMRATLRLPDNWRARLNASLRAEAERARAGAGDTAGELARWREKRRAAVDARLEGWVSQETARARVAEAEAAIARLEGDARARDGRAREMERLGETLAEVPDLWPRMTTDERARLAALLLEPRGLVVRFLLRGRTYGEHPPSCEIVAVRLKPGVRALLTATGLVEPLPIVTP